jgi:hypothetical protein
MNYTKRIDGLDVKVNFEVDSLHVKRIGIEDLVSYVYIVRVNFAYDMWTDIVSKSWSRIWMGKTIVITTPKSSVVGVAGVFRSAAFLL